MARRQLGRRSRASRDHDQLYSDPRPASQLLMPGRPAIASASDTRADILSPEGQTQPDQFVVGMDAPRKSMLQNSRRADPADSSPLRRPRLRRAGSRVRRRRIPKRSKCFCRLVAISPPTLDHDVIKCHWSSRCQLGQGELTRVGGLVMRTAVSNAASPRHLRWQAAFTIKAYQTLSPIVWHHAFVSDTDMKNWCGGSDLILTWGFRRQPRPESQHA